jgi:uncharacterized repeat protein (TIGR03809 family)
MTYRLDAARRRDIVARWCALAEQRLEHLTELFETGRWRRYHSERAFLENIQEAKAAVEIWRDLSRCEASRDQEVFRGKSAAGILSVGRAGLTPPRGRPLPGQVHRLPPQPVQVAAQPPRRDASIAAEAVHVSSYDAPSVPTSGAPAFEPAAELTRDIAPIQNRYPLLRNAL